MHRVELKEVLEAEADGCHHDAFLMHRVELKEVSIEVFFTFWIVPNAPCGVESRLHISDNRSHSVFLMHRVELKVVMWLYFNFLFQCS